MALHNYGLHGLYVSLPVLVPVLSRLGLKIVQA